jgi:hypothetical protein
VTRAIHNASKTQTVRATTRNQLWQGYWHIADGSCTPLPNPTLRMAEYISTPLVANLPTVMLARHFTSRQIKNLI